MTGLNESVIQLVVLKSVFCCNAKAPLGAGQESVTALPAGPIVSSGGDGDPNHQTLIACAEESGM